MLGRTTGSEERATEQGIDSSGGDEADATTDAGPEPKLVTRPGGHWVLLYQIDAKVGGKKATLPLGLTLVGASSSA